MNSTGEGNVSDSILNMSVGEFTTLGILSEDGETVYAWGLMNDLQISKWLSDEDIEKLKCFCVLSLFSMILLTNFMLVCTLSKF